MSTLRWVGPDEPSAPKGGVVKGVTLGSVKSATAPAWARRTYSRGGHPEGVSDGLTLPCMRCGVVPVVDYVVDDAFWREHTTREERASVVCLECLAEQAPDVALHVEQIQVATSTATSVLVPVEEYRW